MKSFKRKTLVTIETEKRLLIAEYNARHIRCEACGEQIDRVIAPEPEARSLSGPRKSLVRGTEQLDSSKKKDQNDEGEE